MTVKNDEKIFEKKKARAKFVAISSIAEIFIADPMGINYVIYKRFLHLNYISNEILI